MRALRVISGWCALLIPGGKGVWPAVVGGVLLTALLGGQGCGGCRPSPEEAATKTQAQEDRANDAKKKAPAPPKEAFERLQVALLPDSEASSNRSPRPPLVKPGHWAAFRETWLSRRADLAGELTSFVEEMGHMRPQPLEFFPARLWPRFPAVLPKGQPKQIETLLYVPLRPEDPTTVYSLRSLLHRRGERSSLASVSTLVRLMAEHEHLLVILAGHSVSPAAYAHWEQLPSVYLPLIEGPNEATLRFYHVLRPPITRSVPLPAHSLAWTTISHVVWDGLDPALFSTPQQEALLDWLHWGGQLVISGPETLDKLRASFLAPYLPGESAGTVELDEAAFEELNERFSLPPPVVDGRPVMTKGEAVRRIRILPGQPMVGVALRPHPQAQPVEGTGGLVWQRRVGGGRTVVVRFPLSDLRIRTWKHLDGFVHSVLLGRPGREFRETPGGTVQIVWRSEFFEHLLREDPWGARSYGTSARQLAEALARDPRLGSTVRFLSRDLLDEEPGELPTADRSAAPLVFYNDRGNWLRWREEQLQVSRDVLRAAERLADWHFGGYGWRPAAGLHARPGGVASWTGASALDRAANQSLITSAGIHIPQADFVLKVMAVYLAVLVPLNALLFWGLGRLEWAWAAAPLIALAGAGAVVRLARLDIGFSRSRTEVALLELQGGYPRGHLTRYTALYSSLSTRYTLAFDPPQAVAAPQRVRHRASSGELLQRWADLTLERDRAMTLRDVPVASNSTAILRSEQFLPLGEPGAREGGLQVERTPAGEWVLHNRTWLKVREVGLFWLPPKAGGNRSGSGTQDVQVAYLAQLPPGVRVALQWAPLEAAPQELGSPASGFPDSRARPLLWLPQWEDSAVLGPVDEHTVGGRQSPGRTRLPLTELAREVQTRLKLLPGEMRLVGWTDQALPGLTIQPRAPQELVCTLVVAHLQRGPLPAPLPDRNRLEELAAAQSLLPDEAPPGGDPANPP